MAGCFLVGSPAVHLYFSLNLNNSAMKRLVPFLFLLLLSSFAYSQICNFGSRVIPCSGFVTGQEEAGTLGSYSNTDEWGFLGKGTIPYLADNPYGVRLQRQGTLLAAQIEQRASSTVYDGVIGIGVVKTGTANPALPRLDFDYYYQDQTAGTTAKMNVMTIMGTYSKPITPTSIQLCLLPVPPAGNPPCFGRVGIENVNPSYTLDVNGMLRVQTTLYTSDARFKQNVQTIEHGMEVISKLRGTTYEFRTDQKLEGFDFGAGLQAGFIAQEVEEVLPHLVATDDNGYKSVAYANIIPYLVEAMKDLQAENKALASKNATMQAQIDALLEGRDGDKGAQGSLGANLPAELYQNVPNPFNQVTEIRFTLPETVREASLLIFDMNGKQLRSIQVNARGMGSVKLAAGDLNSGMYLYTLLADGQEIGTRRMIITD